MTQLFPVAGRLSAAAALRDIRHRKADVRLRAAVALAAMSETEEKALAGPALLEALDDPDPRVRSTAALGLGELAWDGAVGRLADALEDGNMEVRQHAAVALGTLANADGFGPLVRALRVGPPDVRFQAATSMVEIDAAASLEPLLDALAGEEDEHVIGAIALGLGAIGDARAIEPLARILEHPGAGAVFDAAYALADLGDPRAAEALRPYAGSAAYGWDAVTALENLGSAAAADVLASVSVPAKSPPTLAVRGAAALIKIAPAHPAIQQARAALLAGLSSRKVDVRGLAVQLLGEVGGPWAREPLQRFRRKWSARKHREEIDAALASLAEER